MIKLDDDLLKELGLAALPPEEKRKLLAHIYETLEMRVGMKLAEQMSDAQLSEFEQFIDSNNEAGALRWLESNFPSYKDVVAAEFDILKREIAQVAPQILATNMPAPGQPTQGQPPVDPRYQQQGGMQGQQMPQQQQPGMYQQSPQQPYYPPQPPMPQQPPMPPQYPQAPQPQNPAYPPRYPQPPTQEGQPQNPGQPGEQQQDDYGLAA